DVFDRRLRSTYLSYLEPEDWEYGPVIHTDPRGNLAELLKSPHFGQIFVSRTHPGITRGNHYHHTKTEKFIVVAGTGLIRLRRIDDPEKRIVEFTVHGGDPFDHQRRKGRTRDAVPCERSLRPVPSRYILSSGR
ncbi:MAG: hypothetical protein Q4C47_09935, partial [Planctomycetia bacterium]|nr:hypothetical protein [Planctomycetia bacterium]